MYIVLLAWTSLGGPTTSPGAVLKHSETVQSIVHPETCKNSEKVSHATSPWLQPATAFEGNGCRDLDRRNQSSYWALVE